MLSALIGRKCCRELGLLLQQAAVAQMALSTSKAAQLPATSNRALSTCDGALHPAAGPLQCAVRAAKDYVPDLAEEQVVTPDRLEPPSSFQDGWDEPADHMLVSSAFSLTCPSVLPCFGLSDVLG